MEIYIHIPFCVQKCEYCSFVSFPASTEAIDDYLKKVLWEAEQRKSEINEMVSSVYIGGGTPSLLTSKQLTAFIRSLKQILPLNHITEFTIESNPGTISYDFIQAAMQSGVNRISLGMQSSNDRILKSLGRIHLYRDVVQSVNMLNSAGFSNFNLDLMFGIPGQTLKEWVNTLKDAILLHPKHISAYGLIPEEGTRLFQRLEKGEVALPSQDLERDMYDYAVSVLEKHGYKQYEISNFAQSGFECIHNIGYWTQIPYMGLGVAAASMRILEKSENGLVCIRRNNPESLDEYNIMIQNSDNYPVKTEYVSQQDSRFETIMLALRMNSGISQDRFLDLHGIPIEKCYGKCLEKMKNSGLMVYQNHSWKLTRRGMDIQNSILVEFMDDQS